MRHKNNQQQESSNDIIPGIHNTLQQYANGCHGNREHHNTIYGCSNQLGIIQMLQLPTGHLCPQTVHSAKHIHLLLNTFAQPEAKLIPELKDESVQS